jgi:hypothetical protein
VIVAVIVVRVVQVARHNIIDVIAVPDGLVTAGRAMLVLRFVLLAVVVGRAIDRVRRADRDFAHLRLHLHLFSSQAWLAEPTPVRSADEQGLTDVKLAGLPPRPVPSADWDFRSCLLLGCPKGSRGSGSARRSRPFPCPQPARDTSLAPPRRPDRAARNVGGLCLLAAVALGVVGILSDQDRPTLGIYRDGAAYLFTSGVFLVLAIICLAVWFGSVAARRRDQAATDDPGE